MADLETLLGQIQNMQQDIETQMKDKLQELENLRQQFIENYKQAMHLIQEVKKIVGGYANVEEPEEDN